MRRLWRFWREQGQGNLQRLVREVKGIDLRQFRLIFRQRNTGDSEKIGGDHRMVGRR